MLLNSISMIIYFPCWCSGEPVDYKELVSLESSEITRQTGSSTLMKTRWRASLTCLLAPPPTASLAAWWQWSRLWYEAGKRRRAGFIAGVTSPERNQSMRRRGCSSSSSLSLAPLGISQTHLRHFTEHKHIFWYIKKWLGFGWQRQTDAVSALSLTPRNHSLHIFWAPVLETPPPTCTGMHCNCPPHSTRLTVAPSSVWGVRTYPRSLPALREEDERSLLYIMLSELALQQDTCPIIWTVPIFWPPTPRMSTAWASCLPWIVTQLASLTT